MTIKHKIKEIFNEWEEAREFSGVLSISDDKGAIYESAQGFRNKAEKLPNESDTLFAIASGTKLFTAIAICQLIDMGKLSLDTKVWDILPFDLQKVDKEVTIRHLLTHTSGIGDYIDEDEIEDSLEVLELYNTRPVHQWTSLEFYLPMTTEKESKFAPGTEQSYSNSGFILLGLVIEAIGKRSYHDYVRTQIIEPLNLERTDFYATNHLPYNTAIGYVYDETVEDFVTNTLYMPMMAGSDGGIFTCAKDMARVWQGVFAEKLFSKGMLEQFITPTDEFGLGVYIDEVKGGVMYHTEGGDFGTNFLSVYFPETKTVVTTLGNTEVDTFDFISELIPLFIQ